ncbi:MAG: hypothetical protein ACK47B_15470 [Armatimonadota bacterium]
MMSLEEIEQRLAAARQRREAAGEAMRRRWQGGELEQFRLAHDVVLDLEREVAAAKGEEYAVPLDFPVEWDVGAPLPHLLRSDYRTLLSFYAREPVRDESAIKISTATDPDEELLAVVEFTGCVSAKLGSPNDEVQNGHALYRRGLDSYTAQRVVHSRWLAELEAINSVHACYNPARWAELSHYVFWFHDTTFECIAKSYTVELHRESLAAMLERMCRRLIS